MVEIKWIVGVVGLLFTFCQFSWSEMLSISNAALSVQYDSRNHHFQVENIRHQQFLKKLSVGAIDSNTAARKTEKTIGLLGPVTTIEVTLTDGSCAWVMLKNDLPTLYIMKEILNPGPEEQNIDTVPFIETRVDLGVNPQKLKALGTAGLTGLNDHKGSYVHLALADPDTRNGLVAAWLTVDRASGILFSSINNEGAATLKAQLDYGNLHLKPHQKTHSEILTLGWYEDARIGLEKWADQVAKAYNIHLPPKPSGYCTWYSEKFGRACDQVHIKQLTDFIERELKPFGLTVIQIDDRWQLGQMRNGPAKNFTAHNPQGPYPDGMKQTADYITSKGLTAGLWFMPFAGDHQDPFFKQHPEWFVKRKDGRPFEVRWGGTSLDMTQTGARSYLERITDTICSQWGYKYIKVDGLWTGTASELTYVNRSYRSDDKMADAVFSNPDKTNIQAYRDGLRLLRDTAGDDVFILGCCMVQNLRSYGGSIGFVDAMRVGPDNGAAWKSLLRGPQASSRTYFLHGRVWYNDPDPVYIRTHMPINHARLICSWAAVSGQLTVSSDWLPELPPERIDLLKRCMPGHTLLPRPVDLFERPIPSVWLLTDNSRPANCRSIVGFFNWSDRSESYDYTLKKMGLDPASQYAAYDYWSDTVIPLINGRLNSTVEPQSVRVLSLCPLTDHPFILSTSRHITQGIIDLVSEKWITDRSLLQASSRVVAHDPYELRVYLNDRQQHSWQLVEAAAAYQETGEAIPVKTELDGDIVRIKIKPDRSSTVRWNLKLKPVSGR